MKFVESIESNLFKVCFVLPLVVAAIVNYAVLQDEYEAPASIVIKESGDGPASFTPGAAAALFDFGNNTSLEDSYLVREYLLSNSFSLGLSNNDKIIEHFSSSGAPFLQRLNTGASESELIEYLRDRISVQISTETSIITIAFRSFSPEPVSKWCVGS